MACLMCLRQNPISSRGDAIGGGGGEGDLVLTGATAERKNKSNIILNSSFKSFYTFSCLMKLFTSISFI